MGASTKLALLLRLESASCGLMLPGEVEVNPACCKYSAGHHTCLALLVDGSLFGFISLLISVIWMGTS